jgi:hypothetical protein
MEIFIIFAKKLLMTHFAHFNIIVGQKYSAVFIQWLELLFLPGDDQFRFFLMLSFAIPFCYFNYRFTTHDSLKRLLLSQSISLQEIVRISLNRVSKHLEFLHYNYRSRGWPSSVVSMMVERSLYLKSVPTFFKATDIAFTKSTSSNPYQVNGLSARGTSDRIQAMAPSHEHTRALQSSKYFENRAVKVVFH